MYFKSKVISLSILGITSHICSRTLFFFFDDPEGPNLLVVTVMAAVIYFLSLPAYLFNPSTKNIPYYYLFLSLAGFNRLLFVVFVQIVITTIFYFCLV